MSTNDMVAMMKEWGPFAVPLCIFMFVTGGAVIRWLLKDRKDILTQLKTATADQITYREKRIGEVTTANREYLEYGQGIQTALGSLTTEVARLGGAAR